MYTVFIVDDEALIRDGLKQIIDWEALGFTVCGEASNGEDAEKEILEKQPDLTLMDIRMPRKLGLDVVASVREKDFKGRFIILSGYSDFKYAQEAIRYGVEFYLTKPIDEDELLSSVTTIKAALDSENRDQDTYDLLKKKARNVILHDLVTVGLETDSDTIADLELEAGIFQVVIYENFNSQPGSTFYSFADLLKVSNKQEHTFYHFTEDSKDVILLKGTYALNRFQDFLNHYEDVNPPQKGSPMDSLFISYGRPVKQLSELPLSYKDAAFLISRRFFCMPGQHTLGYAELPHFNTASTLQPEKLQHYADYLVGYLQTFNRKNVVTTLTEMENYLYNVENSISEVKLFLTDMYLRIKEKINLIYNTLTIPFPTKQGSNGFQFDIVVVIVVDVIENIVQHVVTGRVARRIHNHLKLFGEELDDFIQVRLFLYIINDIGVGCLQRDVPAAHINPNGYPRYRRMHHGCRSLLLRCDRIRIPCQYRKFRGSSPVQSAYAR
jgi:two-component system, response regulator YesN